MLEKPTKVVPLTCTLQSGAVVAFDVIDEGAGEAEDSDTPEEA